MSLSFSDFSAIVVSRDASINRYTYDMIRGTPYSILHASPMMLAMCVVGIR